MQVPCKRELQIPSCRIIKDTHCEVLVGNTVFFLAGGWALVERFNL